MPDVTARLEIEQRQLANVVGDWAETMGYVIGDAVKAVAFDLERRVKERTPVVTGRLRASVHTLYWGGPVSYTYSAKSVGGRDLARIRKQAKSSGLRAPRIGNTTYDGTLGVRLTSPNQAVVGTNVEYAIFVEARSAMFRLSTIELRGKLTETIQAELRRRRRGR